MARQKYVMVRLLDVRYPVRIYILADGSVTGTVGDSRLIDARVLRHRPTGVSRQARHELVDYMIQGRLMARSCRRSGSLR
jgi:hypothetical protein